MKALIIGAGLSGQSAKEFLEKSGAETTLFSDHIDLAVISPGVRVTGEIDLAFNNMPVRPESVIAVTGTNGKTTVVNLLKLALGSRGVLCGNVGVPVTRVAKELGGRVAVVEVSSFQLEIPARLMLPDVAVILNVRQDHLERHGDFWEYARCKARITEGARFVVLNRGDKTCREIGKRLKSARAKTKGGEAQRVIWFRGKNHQEQNANAVRAVAKILKIDKAAVNAAIKNFGADHRIESVAKIGGVEFINDSKATNISACLAAAAAIKAPIELILGGLGKGQDFSELFSKLPPRVRGIYVLGSAAPQILLAANGGKWAGEIRVCLDLREATIAAFTSARASASLNNAPSCVLLSPACSSFDMFKNYEDRGNQFKQIVSELSAENQSI